MLVIKKLNNNAAICLDDDNNKIVALGNGIGFPKTPYELNDLSKISKTFYGINPKYFGLINEIEDEVIEVSSTIVEYAKGIITNELNPNLVFTLADHIKFAIDRTNKSLTVKMPMDVDLKLHYEKELEIGKKAVTYINKKLNVHLRKEEATSIALHLINAQNFTNDEIFDEKEIIDNLTIIIEQEFNIKIDKEGFNYSRFVSHLQYLLKRGKDQLLIDTENGNMFDVLVEKYPETYKCVNKMSSYLEKNNGITLNKEEKLYLINPPLQMKGEISLI